MSNSPPSSPPRPSAIRIGSLRGFLPLSDNASSVRGQALPALIQSRSTASMNEVRSSAEYERGSIREDDSEHDVEGDMPRKRRLGRRKSLMSEGSQALYTPEMRSMRLIGHTNPRYEWAQYWKDETELKKMKKSIRQYYERNNRLISSYIYIDRLLDSSLPHNLIQEYHHAASSLGNIPSPIPEESISSPADGMLDGPKDSGHQNGGAGPHSKSHPSVNFDKGCSDQGDHPHVKVKRTPKDIYKVPDEGTPLLGNKDSEGPRPYELENGGDDFVESNSSVVTVAIYVNLVCNAILLAGKIAVIVLTSSLSVLASLVDALLDFLSTAIVWVTTRLISRQDRGRYPIGRRRLEPLGVLIFGVVMICSFVQVFIQCFKRLNSNDRSVVQLGIPAIVILASTVLLKLGCWFWSRLVKNSSVQALAQDAITDVIFNIFSIIFPLVGYYAQLWWLDSLGGLLLSLYVIYSWSKTSALHIKNLTGAVASAEDRNVLLYLTMRFAKTINSIQGCQAYHAGDKLNVEVDIVLDEGMSLRDCHDVGESLQYVLESVPIVDRAFVHLDYAEWNVPSHMEQQGD